MPNRWIRFAAFNLVGAVGIGVQLATLWLMTRAGIHYQIATACAVVLSVGHNFVWHRLWTWRDRPDRMRRALARFVLANGAVSLAGNLAVMAVLVAGTGMRPVAANVVAIAVCGLLNFWIGDLFVFPTAMRSSACPPFQAALLQRSPLRRR